MQTTLGPRKMLGTSDSSDGVPESTLVASPSQQQTPDSSSSPAPVTLPDESIEAQEANAASGSGGPGSVIAETATTGGLTVNLIFDAAAMAAPASFRNGIIQAAAILSATITDNISVNLQIDYSGTGGGAAAGPDSGQWESYASIRADLINNASPGDTAFNALPAGSTIQGQSSVAVWNAQLKLWGLLGANDSSTDDGAATFSTDINQRLLVGVALHELTHAMGRVPYGPQPDVFDLFRFTSAGTRLFTGGATAAPAYFSLDGGNTKLADYGRTSDSSDFLNSGVQGASDAFNEFYSSNTLQGLTGVDLKQLDALGFHVTAPYMNAVATDGSTRLLQIGAHYFLDDVATGVGPELRYGGAAVSTGQFGNTVVIGAVQTTGGYDIAWKDPTTGQFTFTTADTNGNYTSNISGWLSGNSAPAEGLESTFGQDFNGDGTIGVVPVVIQVDGSTSLVQIGNNYALYTNGSGPTIQIGGAPVVVGQLGDTIPIGAVKTASGYDIAWKSPTTGQFTFTTADNNGNYTSNISSWVSGTSPTTESLESTFGQDFNGDGTIGPIVTVIQTDGSTGLVQIGNNYALYTNGSGPTIQIGGAPVAVGQLGDTIPIGAVKTASGYDIAWKSPTTGQFTFTTADNNGNYTSNISGWVSGNSATAESLESTFGQDFNGDGTIGPIVTVIQTDGSTSLVQIGNTYALYSNGAGPTIKIGGVPIIVGQLGSTIPIGAIQTATGYDIAWKDPTTGQFTFTTADSNGNYTSNLSSWVPGTSTTAETLETTFHQDFNGDGVTGMPAAAVIQVDGSTSLVQLGNNYGLYTNGAGPTIKIGGAPVAVGQLDHTVPIGAIQTAAGYDIAWKDSITGQFTFTTADSDGNYTSNLSGWISGTDATAENLETLFHQDFNGDGVIGVPSSASAAGVVVNVGSSAQAATIAATQANLSDSTLTVTTPSSFNGQIVGFGNGSGDQIDLHGVNFSTLHASFDSTSSELAVNDGSTGAELHFLGNYVQDSFHFADDGHGGTLITAPAGPAQATAATSPASVAASGQDTFVFASNFGQASLSNFNPATDNIAFSKSVFASQDGLAAAIHNDAAGNAVITDAAHDTITLQHVTAAELLAHLTDFHIV
jgi:serralysin